MVKPLQTGWVIFRDAAPPPVHNYSTLYGWVEPSGPFNSNELWRAESKLRLVAYPRETFTPPEIERAAAEVRAAGWAEIRREQAERKQRLQTAWADRVIGSSMVLIGLGGMGFYVWLGCALLRECDDRPRVAHAGWFGRKKRHGRITFGGAYAEPGS